MLPVPELGNNNSIILATIVEMKCCQRIQSVATWERIRNDTSGSKWVASTMDFIEGQWIWWFGQMTRPTPDIIPQTGWIFGYSGSRVSGRSYKWWITRTVKAISTVNQKAFANFMLKDIIQVDTGERRRKLAPVSVSVEVITGLPVWSCLSTCRLK